MQWKERYSKTNRPRVQDIGGYLPLHIFTLYQAFADTLARTLNMTYVKPVYTQTYGWKFQYGRSGMILLDDVRIGEGCFGVQSIEVYDEHTLQEALALARQRYADEFEERFSAFAAKRTEAQKQRTQKRTQREKAQVESFANITPGQFNQYRWSPKVSRQALARLYEANARQMPDDTLLDDIGYALYARCVQGRDTWEFINSGRLQCHNCGAILPYQASLMQCECGQQYLFRDYMRSFRANNMPSGSARDIFDRFITQWPQANTGEAKMELIDWLIHEFHANLLTGVKGRFVGINLIEGSKDQIQKLILELAYGATDAAAKEAFQRNLKKK
jgi:hypothetical protein